MSGWKQAMDLGRVRFIALFFFLAAALSPLPGHTATRPEYNVDYIVRFLPAEGTAAVRIVLAPGEKARATRLDFRMPESRYAQIQGDGNIERNADRAIWTPPKEGGELHYRVAIDHRRRHDGYDARITLQWAILRGDDLVPPVRVRATKGSDSRARLRFELPAGWSRAETPYLLAADKESYVVVNPDYRFDRPVGWIIAGDLGIRSEFLEDTKVSVAAPRGSRMPRLEILGYLNATALELKHVFGDLPPKLLIVGAEDPMWRGGLSGPRSLWLHADRPLISENGTSTLLHELVHVVSRMSAASDDDWIVEGLAEYYSIVLLNRVGLTSDQRRDKSIAWMRQHGRKVKSLKSERSHGPRTARAVALFADLDREIRQATRDGKSLDEVARELARQRTVSFESLDATVTALMGHKSHVLEKAPLG